MGSELEIFTDGACSGNPGEAAIGVVIREDGKIIKEISKSIGKATNNIAEYTALIYALQEAAELKAERLKIFTDSELLYKQVTGAYQVKNDTLKQLYDQVVQLSCKFKEVAIQHVLREKNREADKLATQALKKKQSPMVALMPRVGEESPSSGG